ncbi:MAG: alkaline phosphatase [Marinilabiliaceae bacterium]|nr:alkaline phosphatase [Marinilabiliaceae bacterium]
MMLSKKQLKSFSLICSFFLLFQGVLVAQNASVAEQKRNDYKGKEPKYVFLFIGDGFGLSQANAAEAFLSSEDKNVGIKKLNLSKFPAQGFYTTHAHNRYITGSAAAGTALATGHKTSISTISMCPSKQKPLKTVAELAKEKGMKVGVISSVSIDHATPAVFYAHQPERSNYYEIDVQLSESNFDFFGGGGLKCPEGNSDDLAALKAGSTGIDNGDNSVSNKKKNAIELAKERAYKYINTKADFEKLSPKDGKVIAVSPVLCGGSALRYSIDQTDEDITLAQFTAKGIEMLDNKNGFFMMVEGGKIDWTCHRNDAATAIHEVIDFDNAIAEAIDFYNNHPKETLIVVVGDHETGGLTMGFAGSHYESAFKKLKHQKVSGDAFDVKVKNYIKSCQGKTPEFSVVLDMIKKDYGLGDESKGLELKDFELDQLRNAFVRYMEKGNETDEQSYLLYGGYNPLTVKITHLLAHKAGISWTTFSHTGTPIPARAMGPGQDLFSGYFDNTDIPKNIMKLIGVEFPVVN